MRQRIQHAVNDDGSGGNGQQFKHSQMPALHAPIGRTLHPTIDQFGQHHAQQDGNRTRDQLQRNVCDVQQVHGQQGAEIKH